MVYYSMNQFQQRALWDKYKNLLDQGRVTVHQDDDLNDLMFEVWEGAYDEGQEDAKTELDSERGDIWDDGYKEGLAEGEANAL